MNTSTTETTSVESYSNVTLTNMTSTTGVTSPHLAAIWYGCFVLMGVILPMGVVCNTLSFVVFVTSKALIKTSTGHYLVALSIADWLFLLGDLIRWLHTTSPATNSYYFDVDFMFTKNIVCKLTHFIRYGSKLASAWITIAITMERFISVRWPLHAHHLSTVSRARIVISVTYVICFTLGAYPLWTVAVDYYKDGTELMCTVVKEVRYTVWSWIVLRIGSLLLPGLIMCVVTGLIIFTLAKAKDQRMRRLSSRQQCNVESKEHVSKHNMERQLTIILLAVALSFILLRLPYTITYYVNSYKSQIWDPLSLERSMVIYTFNKIADVIATSNYAINFFLYCVCGSTFRNQLRALMCSRTSRCHRSNRACEYATVSVSLTDRCSPYKTNEI